jgi:hypothetical protein
MIIEELKRQHRMQKSNFAVTNYKEDVASSPIGSSCNTINLLSAKIGKPGVETFFICGASICTFIYPSLEMLL